MSRTLEKDLAIVRSNSIKLREERLKLQQVKNLSADQLKRLEEVRKQINRCRKDERHLSGLLGRLRK